MFHPATIYNFLALIREEQDIRRRLARAMVWDFAGNTEEIDIVLNEVKIVADKLRAFIHLHPDLVAWWDCKRMADGLLNGNPDKQWWLERGREAESLEVMPMQTMKISLPERWNYQGYFLTFDCNLSCSYCDNQFHGELPERFRNEYAANRVVIRDMNTTQWITALNRVEYRADVPVTLEGGEPTQRGDFYELVRHVSHHNVDLLSNGVFDAQEFVDELRPDHFSVTHTVGHPIRLTAHVDCASIPKSKTAKTAAVLVEYGFKVIVFALDDGTIEHDLAQEVGYALDENGVDFGLKPLMSEKVGPYKYPEGVQKKRLGIPVTCRTSELLVSPNGGVYRCHSDMYQARGCIGHILGGDFRMEDSHRPCENFGDCHPCDCKLKTDRLLRTGYCTIDVQKTNL